MKIKKGVAVILCALTVFLTVCPVFAESTDADAAAELVENEAVVLAANDADEPAENEADADGTDEKPEKLVCETAMQTVAAIYDGGYTGGEIHIAKAQLTTGGETKDVYFVSLMGMCFIRGKTNSLFSALKSALNLKSSYSKLAKKLIFDNIESGASIVFCGHSLGGMVCQQFRTDKEITKKYEIIATLAAGSPYVMVDKEIAEGALVRLADVSDKVACLSPALIFSRKNHKDRIVEDGGYDGDSDAAHNQSYRSNSVWDKYDALGIEGGDSVISFMNKDVLTFVSDKVKD